MAHGHTWCHPDVACGKTNFSKILAGYETRPQPDILLDRERMGVNVDASEQSFSRWVKEPDVNILGVPSRDTKVVT